jgi:hypothetical protein
MIDQMIESENKILIMISVSHVLDTPTNNQMINNKQKMQFKSLTCILRPLIVCPSIDWIARMASDCLKRESISQIYIKVKRGTYFSKVTNP